MRVIGDFNNISQQLKDTIKPLKTGQVAKYQLLYGKPDFSPNPKKLLYPRASLTLKDTIIDPFTGKSVDIGVYDPQRTQEFSKFMGGNTTIICCRKYWATQSGMILLTGGVVADQEMYEWMELTNLNSSNPYRDTTINAKFERTDEIKDARNKSKKIDNLTTALVYVSGLSTGDMRELAAALNWDETAEIEVIESQIKEFAATKPDEFVAFGNDEKGVKDKAIIKYALREGIIQYDVSGHRMIRGGTQQTLASLTRQDGMNEVDSFFDWIRTSPKGGDVITELRKKMSKQVADKVRTEKVAE